MTLKRKSTSTGNVLSVMVVIHVR